jgi:hypothetical protein
VKTNIDFWSYLLSSSYSENCSITFFFFGKWCLLWDILETHYRAGQDTDDNTAHAHCMLDTYLLLIHCNNGYTNAPHCTLPTMPVLFKITQVWNCITWNCVWVGECVCWKINLQIHDNAVLTDVCTFTYRLAKWITSKNVGSNNQAGMRGGFPSSMVLSKEVHRWLHSS